MRRNDCGRKDCAGKDYRGPRLARLRHMQGKSAHTPRLLNGILALGFLMVLSSLAGLTATAVSNSCGQSDQSDGPDSAGKDYPRGDGAGLHPQRIEGKFGYADGAGKLIIPARFDGADAFSEGLAVVLDSGRFGYIDSRGRFAIPAVYRLACAFRDGRASVRFDSSWLFIDRGGRRLDVALSSGE